MTYTTESNSYMLMGYAKNHGFDAWPNPDGSIMLAIPASDGTAEYFHCSTISQLRELLGY